MCVFYFTCRRTLFAFCLLWLWCFISVSERESASRQAGGSSCCYLLCVCAHALLGVTYSVTRCKKKMCRDMCVCVCVCCECRTFCRTAASSLALSHTESGEKAKRAVLVPRTGFLDNEMQKSSRNGLLFGI